MRCLVAHVGKKVALDDFAALVAHLGDVVAAGVLKFTATDGRFYTDYYPRSFIIE